MEKMSVFFKNINKFTTDVVLCEQLLLKSIVKRISLGEDNPEVQLLVKMIFENQVEIEPELKNISRQQFARLYAPSYMVGDVARLKEQEFGKEGCSFIAEAVAIFGGYRSYSFIEY